MPLPFVTPRASGSSRGFTLVELMVVVTIFAVLAGLGAFAVAGSSRTQEISRLARGIHFTMLEARAQAISDGFQRRVFCTERGCRLEAASNPGMGVPATWRDTGQSVGGGVEAKVWAVQPATRLTATNPGIGPLGTAKTITFFPDGTASPATVFLRDVNGRNKFKVYVFSATGMSRLVDQW